MEDQLIDAVFELNEDLAIELVKKKLEGDEDPISVIRLVQEGVNRVGIHYAQGSILSRI